MARTYGSQYENITPTTLDDATLREIGRLVRAVAEMEDIINLHICNLAAISESKAIVMLGKTAVSKRLEIAKYLAQMLGESVVKLHDHAFSEHFSDILDCRNAVAHGKLLGVNTSGELAFLTTTTVKPVGESAIQITMSYLPESIMQFAKMAEQAIPQLETHLKVRALRQERLGRPLSPHRKSQPQRTAKRKRQPRP